MKHHKIIRGFPFDVSEKYDSAPTKRIGYDWRNQSGSEVVQVRAFPATLHISNTVAGILV